MSYLSDQELKLASRFLFLSMALIVIQKDMRQIQKGDFKIKEPYLELLAKMSSKATHERRYLRKKMQNEGVKVIMLNKNDSFSSFLFVSNSREEKRNYFNPAIRKKVEIIIQDLISKALEKNHSYTHGDF